MEPRSLLADELAQAGADQFGNPRATSLPSASTPIQFTISEPKPIEIEHLSTFSKLEEHFGKFFTRSGSGQYATFLSQEIQEVLAFQFFCWLERQPLTADYPRATTFYTASRKLLQSFIKYYVNTEVKNDGAGRQLEVESNFRSKLMELGFHSFLDINSSRIRTQDHSVNHVETFMANVIRIFVSFHRSTDNFHLPVQELSTYREVIGAWILDIRNNAPSLTASHFNFMATELKLRYVSNPLAFERDRHGFGPFLQDLRTQFIDIERRVTEFNFMCGSIKV
jgi:hypothetical protein